MSKIIIQSLASPFMGIQHIRSLRDKKLNDKFTEMVDLLGEIRDTQNLILKNNQQQLEFMVASTRESQERIDDSIRLQKAAMQTYKRVVLFVLPVVLVCIAILAYILLR